LRFSLLQLEIQLMAVDDPARGGMHSSARRLRTMGRGRPALGCCNRLLDCYIQGWA
jgi:hypothetical protein